MKHVSSVLLLFCLLALLAVLFLPTGEEAVAKREGSSEEQLLSEEQIVEKIESIMKQLRPDSTARKRLEELRDSIRER